MTRENRSSSDSARSARLPRGIRLALIPLVIGALVLSAKADPPAIHHLRQAQRFSGYGTDTVYVYDYTFLQDTYFNGWDVFTDSFTADSLPGWRYYVTLTTGTPAVTGAKASINGQEYVANEFTNGITRWIDNQDLVPGTNALEVQIKSNADNEEVRAVIFRVKDPTFSIFGRTTYTKLSPAASQPDSFNLPVGAVSPFTLSMINGSPAGSNRATNSTVKINGTQVLGTSDFSGTKATKLLNVSLLAHDSLSILNQGVAGSYFSMRFTATDTTPPIVSVTAPTESLIYAANQILVIGSATDETPGLVNLNARPWQRIPGSFRDSIATTSDAHYTLTVQAVNSAKKVTNVVRHVTRDSLPPYLRIDVPASGQSTVSSDTLVVAGRWVDTTRTTVTIDGDVAGYGYGDSISFKYPLDLGQNRILFRAIDVRGHKTEFTRYVFRPTPGEPSARDSNNTGFSTLSETFRTGFLESVSFIYSGGTPLQVGVVTDSLNATRAAVVRGRVVGRDWGPIGNDTVQVLGHREFGHTLTRNDGRFDLVVNGGGPLTLRFTKPGYLEVQRQIIPPPQDFSNLEDVAILGKSSRRSTADSSATLVARGRFASDANGDRDARLIFPRGILAKVVKSSGDTATFSTMHVRVTEFTVGQDGPRTMPATLPPASAYTYCLDVRLDEADSISKLSGALPMNTTFTKPVPLYVRNFLHVPVGTPIPVGYYDGQSATWKAMKDGIVARIITLSPDSIDSRGTGHGDPQSRLDSLGITSDELVALRSQYAVGDTLWRISTDHFSTIDINFNESGFLAGLGAGFQKLLKQLALIAKNCLFPGSIIECENRVLGQRFPVAGTPFSINYRSFRAPGDVAIRTLRVPVIGTSVPGGLTKITVQLDVAGKHYEQVVSPPYSTSTPPVSIVWDGLDAYGRRIQGSVSGKVSVGYQFGGDLNYLAGTGGASLGDPSASGVLLGPPTGDRSLGITAWSRQVVTLGAPSTAMDGLGGWTISPHHFFDNTGDKAVYFGDGSVMLGDQLPPTKRTFTYGTCDYAGKNAAVPSMGVDAVAMAIGPEGSLYIADNCRGAILRVTPAGSVQRLAGMTDPGNYDGDGLATSTHLKNLTGIALAPDGSIYFTADVTSDASKSLLGRITPDGLIKKIVGTGADSHHGSGDGGPVESPSASIVHPSGVAVGLDGSIFVSQTDDYRIRRIAPNGLISTHAGYGPEASASYDSAGIAATKLRVGAISSLATDVDGNLYACEPSQLRILRITRDGMLTRYAAGGSEFAPYGMAFAPDGAALITCAVGFSGSNPTTTHRIWRRDVDSTMSVIAGGGLETGEGILASEAVIEDPRAIAVASDGTYYIAHPYITVISRTLASKSATELAVPSADGSEVYYFSSVASSNGRHLRTRDALTGAVRYSFGYDGAGRLATIRDVSGLTTTVQRDGGGNPIGIVGPFGHRTRLSVDGTLHLSAMVDTLSQTLAFTTSSDGLISSFTDPNGNTHSFTYAADGRLQRDSEPSAADGRQDLDLVDGGLTRTVTRTTREGRVATYQTTNLNNGTVQRRITGYDGLLTFMSDSTNSVARTWLPNGSSAVDTLRPDARFGMTVPIVRGSSFRVPSGLTQSVRVTRTMDAGFNPPSTKGMWREDVAVNGRAAFRTEFHADSLVFRTQSPFGRTTMSTVDTAGRPITVTISGLTPTSYGYDSQGRIIHNQQGARALRFAYDGRGRLASVIDTLGRTTTFAYDLADRETLRTLPDGRELHFGYDANGNLVRLTPTGRTAHMFSYDSVDLSDSYTPPSLGAGSTTSSYFHNKDQQLRRVTTPDGVAVSMAYGSTTGRLDSLTLPRGRITYFYKTSGNTSELDSLSSPDTVTVHYAYDGPLVTSESWSGKIAGAVDVTYDSDFRVASQSVNGTNSVTYQYDADGLLATAGAENVFAMSDNGLLDSTEVINVTSRQNYSALGELANLRYAASGSALFLEGVTRDGLGRIDYVSETILGTTTTHGCRYDSAGRLYGFTTGNDTTAKFLYDANGNRLSFSNPLAGDTATARYDEQDRLMRYGNTTYSYTQNGELTQKVSSSDTTLYTYDTLGNLVTVVLPNHDRIDYLIDGQSRRVGRKRNGRLQQGWLYQNGLNPVAELDSTGAVTARYVWGTRGHVPDYVVKSGTTYRLVTDHLGSVRLVVNASTGAVAESLSYDAFGKKVADTSPGFISLGYAGGITDTATNLVRFGARDYDPSVGRWTTKDPIGFAGGDASLMAYAAGDPINLIDPTGTDAQDDLDAIGGSADRLSCGLTTKIRDKYFGYNAINKNSRAYRKGQKDGEAILQQLLLSAAGGPVLGLLENAAAALTGARAAESALAAAVGAAATGSRRFTQDQAALVALAKGAKRAGGVTAAEVPIFREWAREYGMRFRGPEAHPGRGFGQLPHILVGPINHIPVRP